MRAKNLVWGRDYIRYCKSRALHLNVQRFKIVITIAPSYTGKNITRLLPLALLLVLRTRNNTDGNKLVIFSGIASYYGDYYLLQYSYFLLLRVDNRRLTICVGVEVKVL